MITSADVGVVMAGPITEYTRPAVDAVRRWLPDAQLVLSSWRGTIPSDLDVDVVVENDDPGSPGRTNTNRMLRSAQSGLARVCRPFALKLRTDAILDGTGFLDWWGLDAPRGDELAVFSERLITMNVAVRPPWGPAGLLFHPSDCVQFGNVDDVRRLWAVPEIDEVANVRHTACRHSGAMRSRWPRQVNEQVLWLGCLSSIGYPGSYCTGSKTDRRLVHDSEASLVNNFLVLEPWQFGVRLPKLDFEVLCLGSVSIRLWLEDWRRLNRANGRSVEQVQPGPASVVRA